MTSKYCFLILVCCVILVKTKVSSAQLPSNNNPNNQIRFQDVKTAEERRNKLIRFIWKEGIPYNVQPNIVSNITKEAFAFRLKDLRQELVKDVDLLEMETFGLSSTAYSIAPKNNKETSQLVLLHCGHGPLEDTSLKKKYRSAIEFFLEEGYHVIVLHMPLIGWNRNDTTAKLPNGKIVEMKYEWEALHKQIVELPKLDVTLEQGAGFRPFLEPVVASINYWSEKCDTNADIIMIGLSGGGWTTHMMAAIDTRIKLSFPVAGSFPLYLRNGKENKAHLGDLEQYYEPLYNEDIAEDSSGGGIATWLEIYALGGIGKNRKQIMVTSQYDDCCFYGDPEKTVNTFKFVVQKKVKQLGLGSWRHELDTTHREHTISPWMLENVVKTNLGLPN